VRKGIGESNLQVSIAGIAVSPGDWIYADADGILVARDKLA
jgi:regulator of ribonuclease activity A